ncbi:hypothetical protein Tco_1104549 [Tanacetum coccineum]
MKAICNIDMPVESIALTTSSKTKMKVPQGKKPGARSGLKRKQSLKHTSESKTKASKSKTGQSDKETLFSLTKEKAQAILQLRPRRAVANTSGCFFLFHSESASRCDALADSTAKADPGISAPNDFLLEQQCMDEGTQNYLLNHLFAGTNPSILVDQTISAGDGLKTVHTDLSQTNELEQQKANAKAEVASLKARRSYPDINQLTKLLVTSLKHEISKILASHDFASCLPTELKELPLKITKLYGDVKELKKHARDMEIKLPGDLKEIPKKLETFISTISSLTSQVTELKTIQWELPVEFLVFPNQISSVQEKLKTVDALPTTKESNLKNDLVDLKGIDVVEEVPQKEVTDSCDKYYDKSPRRGGGGTRFLASEGDRGTSTLKVIIWKKGPDEVISNFKRSDIIHLAGER